ncbi:hypothetical protein, partial [Ensifer sp. Root258]|uniref:hypothetical protein n=1 Tax=Ensifer sp. Root258 TaxID=1736502 RepID=UPI001AEC80DF
ARAQQCRKNGCSYQSIGAAGTLQTTARSDPKAIAEMETLLGELLALYRSTAKEASTPEPPASTPAAP